MKKITFIILFIAVIGGINTFAQSFTVTANRNQLGKGNITKNIVAKLPTLKKITAKVLVFDFKMVKEASNISIIAMDNNRQELGERVEAPNFKGGKINVPISLAIRSSKTGVNFYMVKLPTDPEKAALVRVAPVLIASF